MFKKSFWEKYSTLSDKNNKICSLCEKETNNYLLVFSGSMEKIIVCKNCAIDTDAVSKESYIKSLNEMHLEKDLLTDVILVYDKYVNSNPERKSDYNKFKEQWELRKDIRNIDG